MKLVKNLVAGAAAAAMLASPLAFATTAQAANNCTDWKVKHARTALPDLYSVGAKCYDLNANRMARGSLDVVADYDVHTRWFTAKNVSYYSSSQRAWVRGTYHTIRYV